jgi:hypothetical protein
MTITLFLNAVSYGLENRSRRAAANPTYGLKPAVARPYFLQLKKGVLSRIIQGNDPLGIFITS